MRKALILMAAASLAGCSNFDGVRQSLGSPPLVQTEEWRDLKVYGESLDELRAYLRRYDLVVSAGATPPPLTVSVSGVRLAGASPTVSTAPTLTFSAQDGSVTFDRSQYTALLQSYVYGRREQVDGLCSSFFDGLQTLASGTQWSQDNFNILANTAGVIGGLTEASAKKLAILSGLQVAVNDSFNATKSALLLNPAPHSVYQLVLAEQATVLANSGAPISFEQAERQVRNYARPCTQNGIKDLIEEALQTTADERSGKGDRNLVVTALAPVLDVLNQGAATPTVALSPSDAVALYWAFILADNAGATADIQAEQTASLAPLEANLAANAAAALADGAKKARVVGALRAVAATYGWVAVDAKKAQTAYLAAMTQKSATEARVAAAEDKADAAEAALAGQKQAAAQAQTEREVVEQQLATSQSQTAVATAAAATAITKEQAALQEVQRLQTLLTATQQENAQLKAAQSTPPN